MTKDRGRVLGRMTGWRSRVGAALLVLVGFVRLFAPILDSYSAPSRREMDAEAPWLLALEVSLVILLGLAIWIDSGRSAKVTGVLGTLVCTSVAVRVWLTPRLSGFEPVFVLPMLAGMAFGVPAGVFVGAVACLISSIAVDAMSSAIVGQLLVWACFGALGGLLSRLRVGFAWLWGIVLGFIAGPLAGVLLNLIGWPSDGMSGDSGFVLGLPPVENLIRLLRYSLQTSLVYDTMRGLTTAAGIAVVGLPILSALRRGWGTHPRLADQGLLAISSGQIHQRAVDRRERVKRIDALWPDAGQQSDKNPGR